jgi:predicted RNA-binding Zn-ribbon protein involved in translation (DUF1610 family)
MERMGSEALAGAAIPSEGARSIAWDELCEQHKVRPSEGARSNLDQRKPLVNLEAVDGPPPGPRIVTLDIETAPLESFHWKLWDENIALEQIQSEWCVLSFAAKWLGDESVTFDYTGGRGAAKVREDKDLLKKLWFILDAADIVIAQNGREFDLKKINARMLMAGLRPYRPVKVIDTMLSAKRHFGFTSNRLAWLSSHLTDSPKSEHKRFPGFELWTECLKDNPAAWDEMRHYNCQDVVATEKLYLKLRPWIAGHPNLAVYQHNDEPACPKCGAQKLQSRGKTYTNLGEFYLYQCIECGGHARSRQSIKRDDSRNLLVSQ